MSATLTIRLRDRDREILETAAKGQGTGLSGFIRKLAEAEARRLAQEESRVAFSEIMRHVAAAPMLQAELDAWGTPDWEDLDIDRQRNPEAYDAWVRGFLQEK